MSRGYVAAFDAVLPLAFMLVLPGGAQTADIRNGISLHPDARFGMGHWRGYDSSAVLDLEDPNSNSPQD
jgi:hypothetical protein